MKPYAIQENDGEILITLQGEVTADLVRELRSDILAVLTPVHRLHIDAALSTQVHPVVLQCLHSASLSAAATQWEGGPAWQRDLLRLGLDLHSNLTHHAENSPHR